MNKNCNCPYCKKPSWISKEDYIIEMSIFLGYPKCCTKQYLKDVMQENPRFGSLRREAVDKISKDCNSFGAGFMPCKKHADRIVNQGKNFRRMFRNRICSTPFPYSSKVELKRYLESIRDKYENNKTKNQDSNY